jgi:hypothetical protein
VPTLSIHTISDVLIPVEVEEEFAEDVREVGDATMLRQAFLQRIGHRSFTTAELLAAVHAVEAGSTRDDGAIGCDQANSTVKRATSILTKPRSPLVAIRRSTSVTVRRSTLATATSRRGTSRVNPVRPQDQH